MKPILVFLIFAVMTQPAFGENSLRDVRACLERVPTVQDDLERRAVAETCLESAKPFLRIRSVSGPALFIKASSYMNSLDGTFGAYEAIDQRLTFLYRKWVARKLAATQLRTMTNQELLDSLEAISIAFRFHSMIGPSGAELSHAIAAYGELEKRRANSKQSTTKLRDIMTESARWDLLDQLVRFWPALGAAPAVSSDVIRSGELRSYEISGDGLKVHGKGISLRDGTYIVMNGNCHLALDAIDMLSRYEDFNRLMLEHGLVLTSRGDADFSILAEHNKKFPAFAFRLIDRPYEWQAIGVETYASPTFTFFKDGVEKFKYLGVSADLPRHFCAGLKSIDLAGGSACGESQ